MQENSLTWQKELVVSIHSIHFNPFRLLGYEFKNTDLKYCHSVNISLRGSREIVFYKGQITSMVNCEVTYIYML